MAELAKIFGFVAVLAIIISTAIVAFHLSVDLYVDAKAAKYLQEIYYGSETNNSGYFLSQADALGTLASHGSHTPLLANIVLLNLFALLVNLSLFLAEEKFSLIKIIVRFVSLGYSLLVSLFAILLFFV